MRVCIHRGAAEIGGSCVELESGGRRLLIDLGLPLDAAAPSRDLVPAVSGLRATDPALVGLVVSHGHRDHWGLMGEATALPPVYVGEATHRILGEATFFGAGDYDVTPTGFLRHAVPLDIGPFRVTPYLADHSAFDAYALLVEAGGRRLFYTGDFRGHGRKAALFERLLADPPDDVDVLLIEGTHVRPAPEQSARPVTEAGVERRMTDVSRRADGPVLVAMSAQHIDRVVSVYRACLRSGRTLIVDLYAARIAAATGNPNIPQPGFERYRVWVPQNQRVRVKRAGEFEKVALPSGCRIYPEELHSAASSAVFLFRTSLGPELERAGCIEGATFVWSQWAGYLSPDRDARLAAFLKRHGLRPVHVHTSGHASIDDARRLVEAMRPRRVVPIHTFGSAAFDSTFGDLAPVEVWPDHTWWLA